MVKLVEDHLRGPRQGDGAIFPAYCSDPPGASLSSVTFRNPSRGTASGRQAPDRFGLWLYQHDSFAPEWPLPVDVPTALRGFRTVLGLSQVKFADALKVTRVNVERWETGRAKPFRGHVHALISLVRPLVSDAASAGQLLNLAAAAVCPKLTRPAATYSGDEIRRHLIDGRYDHGDLAPALLHALVSSRVLVPLNESDPEVEADYIPFVGIRSLDQVSDPWDLELQKIARSLSPEDRVMWFALGARLRR